MLYNKTLNTVTGKITKHFVTLIEFNRSPFFYTQLKDVWKLGPHGATGLEKADSGKLYDMAEQKDLRSTRFFVFSERLIQKFSYKILLFTLSKNYILLKTSIAIASLIPMKQLFYSLWWWTYQSWMFGCWGIYTTTLHHWADCSKCFRMCSTLLQSPVQCMSQLCISPTLLKARKLLWFKKNNKNIQYFQA